jgi:hypothetical protein
MQDGGKGPNHFDYELVKVVKDQEESPKKEASHEDKKEEEEKP